MASYKEDNLQPYVLVNRKQPTNTVDRGAYHDITQKINFPELELRNHEFEL